MPLSQARETIRSLARLDEATCLHRLMAQAALPVSQRARISGTATQMIKDLRAAGDHSMMELFLDEYGLNTDEGIALMALAEALLRVPDAETQDTLIADKIGTSDWAAHLGQSDSRLVNASSWALLLTGRVLEDGRGMAGVLQGAVRRLGEPVIRVAVGQAMKQLGQQFVLGQTIDEAMSRGKGNRKSGYTHSFDMLGEAAMTAADAESYFQAYAQAIDALARSKEGSSIAEMPGISVKLSALHPRYEEGQRDRVMRELTEATLKLARQACAAGIGLNIDAEEADRLELSLDVIEAVFRSPDLAGWDGFGVVVQAYGRRASGVIDWLYALADQTDRRLMVRLVKGAYWDTEIKRAQVEGLADFPVFTRKPATDVSYICCARKLLGMTDRIYPQFATHNAHTVAAILDMADDVRQFEFQRLHGMGEALHDQVMRQSGGRCRIYAPVGKHRDLLAYLVRRLLENGANSSFVNQIVDDAVPAEEIAADPFDQIEGLPNDDRVVPAADLFGAERRNSAGFDLHDLDDLDRVEAARRPFATTQWQAGAGLTGPSRAVHNPARPDDHVGDVTEASPDDVAAALEAVTPWTAPAAERAAALSRAADLYEARFGEIFALLTREAGKTPLDAVAELREAVDFLRYYAARALELTQPARGVITCISPWNFPLAIFTGQIAAALAAGNGVLAKPAEATSLTADLGVQLLLAAGVPSQALHLLPGQGSRVGVQLTSAPQVAGVCFTGSTATAQGINRAMAQHLAPGAPLVAETGGLNAMIVDSTALPEQTIRDVVASAFQSAGQRCSALRMLYLQEDVAQTFLTMLQGAMDELVVGNPWEMVTDVGPVIDARAQADIQVHVDAARAAGTLVRQIAAPEQGHFVGPALIRVAGIQDLTREVFGPVLHVATYKAGQIDEVIEAINATGYGLTFGVQSRIDSRIAQVCAKVRAGNIYVNRNQIGAIVGSQPFGGEGLSGTGPKAGGPAYVPHFTQPPAAEVDAVAGAVADPSAVQQAINGAQPPQAAPLETVALPGPTGESNLLSTFGRGVVLCLGPGLEAAQAQAEVAAANGCVGITCAPGGQVEGHVAPDALTTLTGFALAVHWGEAAHQAQLRQALAARDGALIPLVTDHGLAARCRLERHVCTDTTAACGNTELLSEAI